MCISNIVYLCGWIDVCILPVLTVCVQPESSPPTSYHGALDPGVYVPVAVGGENRGGRHPVLCISYRGTSPDKYHTAFVREQDSNDPRGCSPARVEPVLHGLIVSGNHVIGQAVSLGIQVNSCKYYPS